jgi:hypothetical protein
MKVVWKVVITFAFAFDKYGKYRGETGLTSFLIGLLICYKRLTTGIFFDKSVYYASASYDLMITLLYLFVTVHNYANA